MLGSRHKKGVMCCLFVFLFSSWSLAQTHSGSFLHGNFSHLQTLLSKHDDTLRVFNFWATWCAPCVKELPFLLESEKASAGKPIQFIFVSLDFAKDTANKLPSFIVRTMNENSTVFWLYDLDANAWVPKVEKKWNGNIPVTLLVKGNKRKFINHEFSNQAQVISLLDSF